MRQTVLESLLQWEENNCTPAWVSLETHYTVETCTRTLTSTTFPPIVITGNRKEIHHVLSSPSPHCPAHSQKERWKAKVNTRVTYDFYRIHEKVTLCVSGRLVGSVRPPVFTHKQPNLQSDRLVWVWSPVSHSPGATLAQGAGSERAGDTSQPFTLYSLEKSYRE